MRILLVEDERGIADFVERALRAQGHAVEVAADGVEGGRRAVGSDPDLVILDVMLPGRSGLEILEEIRTVKPRCRSSCSPPAPRWPTRSQASTPAQRTT
jgi:DNA-binding response OmpR family regulator